MLSMFVRRRRNERARLALSEPIQPPDDHIDRGRPTLDEPGSVIHESPRPTSTAPDEIRPADLEAEIEELEQQLEERTSAWQEARDQLSEIRLQIAAISERSSTSREIEALDDADWAQLRGDSPPP
jgi:hypothetical protein